MSNSDWGRRDDDEIGFLEYVEHRTATMPDGRILLRLVGAASADRPDEDAQALQMAIDREDLSKVVLSLLNATKAPHIPAPPTDSRH